MYVTDVKANGSKTTGVTIPADQNQITDYPIAEIKRAPNPTAAAAFISYVLGPDGQQVLSQLRLPAAGLVRQRMHAEVKLPFNPLLALLARAGDAVLRLPADRAHRRGAVGPHASA